MIIQSRNWSNYLGTSLYLTKDFNGIIQNENDWYLEQLFKIAELIAFWHRSQPQLL
jgi:hypothetical protein